MDSILSLIKEILNDILSPVMGKGIISFIEKVHKMRFIKNVNALVREYVNNHDGTILTTGAFERYLSYYHPIEKYYSWQKLQMELLNPELPLLKMKHISFLTIVLKRNRIPLKIGIFSMNF